MINNGVNLKNDFNPRSYKRSDVEWNILYVNPNSISIHAPTRGATFCKISLPVHSKISIHAPTRGATAKMHNIPYASLQ